jgi:DNA-binding MarR family transcriptional regulator
MILRTLLAHPALSPEELIRLLGREPARVRANLARLEAEGFLQRRGAVVAMAGERV